jgi:hypothetical protein
MQSGLTLHQPFRLSRAATTVSATQSVPQWCTRPPLEVTQRRRQAARTDLLENAVPAKRTVHCSAVRQPEQCRPRSPAASHPIPTPRSGWPVQLGPPTVRGGACGGVPLQRSGRRAPTGTRAQTLALISAYWLTHSRPFMLYRFAMLVSCSNRSIDPACVPASRPHLHPA